MEFNSLMEIIALDSYMGMDRGTQIMHIQQSNEDIEEYCDKYWHGRIMVLPEKDISFLKKSDYWREFVESCIATKVIFKTEDTTRKCLNAFRGYAESMGWEEISFEIDGEEIFVIMNEPTTETDFVFEIKKESINKPTMIANIFDGIREASRGFTDDESINCWGKTILDRVADTLESFYKIDDYF